MFISRRGALLAAVFSAGLSFGAPASAESLADAIALAYQTNPTLQAQRATLRALDENIVQARSGWRPGLSASASGQYTETRTPRQLVDLNGDGVPETSVGGIDESNSASAGLNLTQPVWTGGRVGSAVSAARADVLAGQENLRRIEAEVLGGVIVAYVDVRRDQEALRIRQDNVQVLTRQLEETDARFEVGEITRTDVAQAQARLAAAEAQMRSAEAQLAISRAAYAAVVGQNPGSLDPEPTLAGVLPASVDQAYEAAERNNPQLRQARYNAQAAAARVAAARAERMPNLSLSGSVGWSGLADPFEPSDYSRNVTGRATLTVPIFTGGLNNSRVRAARERETASELSVEQARRTALQNVTQAWSQLLAARANIGSTDVQVRAARIAAEGVRQEQQVGLRTTIDVLNAEQELRAAELAQISARRDEYVASASVLSAVGRLDAANLAPQLDIYDATANSRDLRFAWGWTPWEEPIAIVDSVLVPQPVQLPRDAPMSTAGAPR